MDFSDGIDEETQLQDLPSTVTDNLITELNKEKHWIKVIEKINPFFERPLSINKFKEYANPSEKLIAELNDRLFPVNVLAVVLENLQLYDPLSTLLKPVAASIISQPGNEKGRLEVDLDGTMQLTCLVQGVPRPEIKWQVDNTEIQEEDQKFELKESYTENVLSSTLILKKFGPESQGRYFCTVKPHLPSNPEFRSKGVDLTVKYSKPVVITQPQNLCRAEPEPIILTCGATGYPSPNYQWYFNSIKLLDQTESTLMIETSISEKHTGKYKCQVYNDAGSVDTKEVIVNIPEQFLAPVQRSRKLQAVEKIALLIGNEDGNLLKPVNDIVLLAEKLKSVGFKVLPLINLDFDDMVQFIDTFSNLLKEGVYGLLYYAGHGCQREAEILIPPYKTSELCTDENGMCSKISESPEKNKTKSKWITETYIRDKLLKNNPKIRIIILDMCLKYYDCPNCQIQVLTSKPSDTPDLNYLKACATSRNMSSFETKKKPYSIYMSELSKYIGPDMPFKMASIFNIVNEAISKTEVQNMPDEKQRQIPSISTNIYEHFTFVDDVTGDSKISNFFNYVSPPPQEIEVKFENKEIGLFLNARASFQPYKQYIMNTLIMVIDDVDCDLWNLKLSSDRDILDMEDSYTIVKTDAPNEFLIHHLQKCRTGINLSINLLDKSDKIVASTAIFIAQPLIAKVC
ncbi:mucosa-associated lymphoid tissue lymphoma translocation protein 1-like [Neocloeon triangulifer]|uniref:mucosa-associated lymphoid tissue lymphoma translocation protein 1-like n=1 Tax=Neocloeon triangulifer TaxID=2078957 RepID=UPI00286EE21C|nr:mucosa-associated lymphoid tissue lymphoma translocation protein 1-like [Neocloeon triangulifer]